MLYISAHKNVGIHGLAIGNCLALDDFDIIPVLNVLESFGLGQNMYLLTAKYYILENFLLTSLLGYW